MAWLLTRSPGFSFLAGLFYSLAAPTELVIPDSNFAPAHFGDTRRLYLATVWDESPHLAALALLPLIVLFLSLSIRRRRTVYYVASVLLIAIAALLSAFGPIMVAMAALCLLFVLERRDYKRNIALTIGIGAYAYALDAPFLSPSLIQTISAASTLSGYGWSLGSVTALAIVALGWAMFGGELSSALDRGLEASVFALFAIDAQRPDRLHLSAPAGSSRSRAGYKVEMELALALIVVFGAPKRPKCFQFR